MIKKTKKVKVGIMECQQDKCSFKNKGCKPCSVCGTKPNFVKEDCQRCFDCEYKEGSLRWDDNTQDNKEENKKRIKEERKVIEVMN